MYVIAHDSFTRPSPALVQQATNAGVRRPGYEASSVVRASEQSSKDPGSSFHVPYTQNLYMQLSLSKKLALELSEVSVAQFPHLACLASSHAQCH